MKLVELLALELVEWPEDAHVGMQDPDRDNTIWFLERNHGEIEFKEESWRCHGSTFDILISRPSRLASDYDTAIVGYSEWEDECKRISQPQAEEVEVSKPELTYKLDWVEVDDTKPAAANPLTWRDTIIHCQAIIEDCEREIERNTQKLADEGFELIAQINSNLDRIDATLESAVDMGDWRNWQKGDVVECITDEYHGTYSNGKQYTVKGHNRDEVDVFDNYGGESSCTWDDSDAEGLKFIRRP